MAVMFVSQSYCEVQMKNIHKLWCFLPQGLQKGSGIHMGLKWLFEWTYAYDYGYFFMFQQRPDEEAVVDQGGTSTILNIHYEKEELEGKNCGFVWGGVGWGRINERHTGVGGELCHQEAWVWVL